MNDEKLKKIYRKRIIPMKFFGAANIALSFVLPIFLCFTAFGRDTQGKIEKSFPLNVSSIPFEEATPEDIMNLFHKNIPINPQSTTTSDSNETKWTRLFLKFAQKIEISDTRSFYGFKFEIDDFPINNYRPDYLQIDFEFFNEHMDHIFTFSADNYWNQTGNDDGNWHEYNFIERINVKFSKKGTYYIVASIPKGIYNIIMFNIINKYSSGKVKVVLSSGVQELSVFPAFLGISFFLATAIFLFKKRLGNINHLQIGSLNLNMDKFDYIIKLPNNIAVQPFYVKGVMKQRLRDMNVAEFILEQNRQTTFLEIEKDGYKDYLFYYDTFLTVFNGIPEEKQLFYQGETYRLDIYKKDVDYYTIYADGSIENFTNIETVYYAPSWEKVLLFESKKNEAKIKTLLARKIGSAKIWKIAKIKEIN